MPDDWKLTKTVIEIDHLKPPVQYPRCFVNRGDGYYSVTLKQIRYDDGAIREMRLPIFRRTLSEAMDAAREYLATYHYEATTGNRR